MKYLVIVNPVIGRGIGARWLPVIKEKLRDNGVWFDLICTERPWHAAELAKQAVIDSYDVVLTAGGDGTVNEALNGLMQAQAVGVKQPALGMLSTGTGNDFAASMGLSVNLEAACQALVENHRRLIDIGIVKGGNHPEGRYFRNCVGIGFDAAGKIQSRKITWASGMLAYLIAALQTIFLYYKAPTLEIKYDDNMITIPSLMVSIMNGRRIGGGFWTAPESLPDDGFFDLCIAEEVSRRRMFTLIRALKGSPRKSASRWLTR